MIGLNGVLLILLARPLSLHPPNNIRLMLNGLEVQRSLAQLGMDINAEGCSVTVFACLTASLGQDWDSLTQMNQVPNLLSSHHLQLYRAPNRPSPTSG